MTQWQKKKQLVISSPVDDESFANITTATTKDYEQLLEQAQKAFPIWRSITAPKQGEIVRQIGLRQRDCKLPLSTLIAYKTGKPLQESLSEVQEVTDI